MRGRPGAVPDRSVVRVSGRGGAAIVARVVHEGKRRREVSRTVPLVLQRWAAEVLGLAAGDEARVDVLAPAVAAVDAAERVVLQVPPAVGRHWEDTVAALLDGRVVARGAMVPVTWFNRVECVRVVAVAGPSPARIVSGVTRVELQREPNAAWVARLPPSALVSWRAGGPASAEPWRDACKRLVAGQDAAVDALAAAADGCEAVLLHGDAGTGKSLLAASMAAACPHGWPVATVHGSQIYAEGEQRAGAQLAALTDVAMRAAPCIVVLEDMDVLAAAQPATVHQARTNEATFRMLDLLGAPGRRVLVIGVTTLLENVHVDVLRPGRIAHKVRVAQRTAADRAAIVARLLARMPMDAAARAAACDLVATRAVAFVAADLEQVCTLAAMAALADGERNVRVSDVEAALAQCRPTPLADLVHRGAASKTIALESLAGMDELMDDVRFHVLMPFHSPDAYLRMGIRPPRGVLLAGPSGTGKTVLARAIASACNATFIVVNAPDIVSKVVGETEAKIRALFARAHAHAPCILFIDQLDGLAPIRQFTAAGRAQDRSLSALLVELDGVDTDRIAIAGASAGGGLAAQVALHARDLGEIRLAAQILVYPMLDDRTVNRTDLDESGFRLWDNRSNRVGWSAYLGHEAGADKASPIAVPSRNEDLRGLPPTWIGVGSLDLFCDEDMAYAERLKDANVPCETIVVDGVFHAFDGIVEDSAATQRFRESMFAAMRKALAAPA